MVVVIVAVAAVADMAAAAVIAVAVAVVVIAVVVVAVIVIATVVVVMITEVGKSILSIFFQKRPASPRAFFYPPLKRKARPAEPDGLCKKVRNPFT